MVSDWLSTKKKPARTNQIRAVLTTKFKKTAMVFSKRRFENNRKVKKNSKNSNSEKNVFPAKWETKQATYNGLG